MVTRPQGLGGVKAVGQSVPDRHPGKPRQFLDGFVPEAAELDPVEQPSQNPGGILDGLFFPELDVVSPQVLRVGALIAGGHDKGAPGPGGRLLEDEGDILPFQPLPPDPGGLLPFQGDGKLEESIDLPGCKLPQRQQGSSFETGQDHVRLPLVFHISRQ